LAPPRRKIGSVDGSKREEANRRIVELYRANPLKSPAHIKAILEKDHPIYGGYRPPLPPPIQLRNERPAAPYHPVPNAMRQAGLAVLERPQNYVAIHQWQG